MIKEYLERQFTNYHAKLLAIFGVVPTYDRMPSNDELMAMPNNTEFACRGYYDKLDNSGGRYIITTTWTAPSRKIIVNEKTRYLVPICNSNGADNKMEIELNRLGLKPCNSNLSGAELTVDNTYAKDNSDMMDSLIGGEMGITYKIPKGRYFFERPISLTSRQATLLGDSHTFARSLAALTYNNVLISGTQLCFPFLTDGQSAITGQFGGIENVAILGNSNTYNFHIDRTKTITDPDNVVQETIAEKDGAPIKCTGISASVGLWRNVTVNNFYNGIVVPVSNTYMTDIMCNRCHFGLSIANDNKCKGIYGWDCHTLLQIRGAIASVVQVRVDSCVNAINAVGDVSGTTVIDVDGDYCTDSLIKIGNGSTWSRVRNCVFFAIHGRCCALKSYDSVNGTAPKASDLTAQNSSGYGIIHVTNNCEFNNNYIVLTTLQGNPFDTTSDYRTPPIVFAYTSTGNMKNNHIKLNDVNADDSEDYIKSIFQMSASIVVSYRIDTAKNTYYVEAKKIRSYGIDAPTTTEQSTMLANSDILTELQTKIADTNNEYLFKVKDAVTGDNTYVAIANGRFVGLTEAEINQAINPN